MLRMRRILAVVAAFALAAVLTGCSGSEGASAEQTELRVAMNFPPSGIDPHTTPASVASHPMISLLYDRLTEIGEDGNVQPLLATEWNFAANGRSVAFTLRDDATFWDGTAVTPDAVKGSLDRALTLEGSIAASALTMVDSVEVTGEHEVTVHTHRPAADLPAILAGVEGAVINPAALERDDLDVSAAGSGPYELVSYQEGQSIRYRAFEGYWDPSAQRVDNITITGIPNDSTRLSALRSGEIDVALTTMTQYEEAKALGDSFEVHVGEPAVPYMLWLNTGLGPTADRRVRQAINFAIDREAINDAVLGGQCEPAGQPVASGFPGHLEEPPVRYTHDPDRARRLLAQAGLEDGVEIHVLNNAGITLWEQLGTAVQGQLAEVGIDLEISPQESAALFPNWARGTDYHGWFNSKSPKASPLQTWESNYLNPARVPGPKAPGLEKNLARLFDPALTEAQVTAGLERLSTAAVEEASDAFICFAPAIWTSTADVTGIDEMGWSRFSAFGDFRYVGLKE